MGLIDEQAKKDAEEQAKLDAFREKHGLSKGVVVTDGANLVESTPDKQEFVMKVRDGALTAYREGDAIEKVQNGDISGSFAGAAIIELDSYSALGEPVTIDAPAREIKADEPEVFEMKIRTDSVLAPGKASVAGIGNGQKAYVRELNSRLVRAFYSKRGDSDYAVLSRLLEVFCSLAWHTRKGSVIKLTASGPKLPRKMDICEAVRQVTADNMDNLLTLAPLYIPESRPVRGHMDRIAAMASSHSTSDPSITKGD